MKFREASDSINVNRQAKPGRKLGRVTCYQAFRQSNLYRDWEAVVEALERNNFPGVAASLRAVEDRLDHNSTFEELLAATSQLRAVVVMGLLVLAEIGDPVWVAHRERYLSEIERGEGGGRAADQKADAVRFAAAVRRVMRFPLRNKANIDAGNPNVPPPLGGKAEFRRSEKELTAASHVGTLGACNPERL